MATRCIDIAENKKVGATSPIAMFVFVGCLIVLSALMEAGIIYLILIVISFIITQIFFQYKPRFIFYTIKFLTQNSYLTPSFEDKDYVADETRIPEIARVLNEYEYKNKLIEAGKTRHAKRK